MIVQSADTSDIEPTMVDEWSLRYDGFDPGREGLRESLCTLGNGYFATRGAAPEAVADGTHYPGTYVAGLYNRRVTRVAERSFENESIVNVPNWLSFSFRIEDGPWFAIGEVEILAYSQELNLRTATLSRTMRVRDTIGRLLCVEQRRFVSMADPHSAGLETVLRSENWSGRLTIRSGIDGRIANSGVQRYSQFDEHHLAGLTTGRPESDTVTMAVRTSQSDVTIAEAVRTRLVGMGVCVNPERRVIVAPGVITQEMAIDIVPGQ